MDTISLGADGLMCRNGAPWIPVGFNYWPPESGTDCWTDPCSTNNIVPREP